MEESAIFDSVVDIVNEGDYDYYIYDLVPLGHALYYLSMAKVYDEWIGKITQLREQMREYEEVAARMKRQKEVDEDEILGELQYIRNRINSASKILTDRVKTAFFFVVIPEQMILIDTKKAAELFARFDVPIGGYLVNRVIPEELGGQQIPAYLRNRITMQKGELEQIRQTLGRPGHRLRARARTRRHRPADDRAGGRAALRLSARTTDDDDERPQGCQSRRNLDGRLRRRPYRACATRSSAARAGSARPSWPG